MDSDIGMLEQKSVPALLTSYSSLALPSRALNKTPIAPEVDDIASASPEGRLPGSPLLWSAIADEWPGRTSSLYSS